MKMKSHITILRSILQNLILDVGQKGALDMQCMEVEAIQPEKAASTSRYPKIERRRNLLDPLIHYACFVTIQSSRLLASA